MLQMMESNGVITTSDAAIELFHNEEADGPVVEAPSLVKVGNTYVLFFSSNWYNSNKYETSYATATNVVGLYTKTNKPLLVSGNEDGIQLTGPGGLDVSPDVMKVVFHGWNTTNASPNLLVDKRFMYVAEIGVVGTSVALVSNSWG
jgi:hypothetical protein